MYNPQIEEHKWMWMWRHGCLLEAVRRFNRNEALGESHMKALAKHFPDKLVTAFSSGVKAERVRQRHLFENWLKQFAPRPYPWMLRNPTPVRFPRFQ